MSQIKIDGGARNASLSAVITRADGRVENVGRIAYFNRNPVLNSLGNRLISAKLSLRRFFPGGRPSWLTRQK